MRQALAELTGHRHPPEALVVLQQEQRLLDHGVDIHFPLVAAFGARELEQLVHDATAALYLGVDDLEVFLRRAAVSGCQGVEAQGQRLAAGRDGSERVVDLVHHAGRQLADRCQLLGLGQAMLRLPPLGDVLPDGDDVGDLVIVQMHRDLRDPVVARLAACLRLHFDLLDFATVEHAVELALEQLAWLAVQHLEDIPSHGVVP